MDYGLVLFPYGVNDTNLPLVPTSVEILCMVLITCVVPANDDKKLLSVICPIVVVFTSEPVNTRLLVTVQ